MKSFEHPAHRSGYGWIMLFLALPAVLFLPWAASDARAEAQKKFSSPEEAVQALVAAIRAGDVKAMITILGPGGKELVSSGDDLADKVGRDKFLRSYDQKNALQQGTGGKTILCTGDDSWPMPIPIVRKGGQWAFDSMSGKREILQRRVGRNELHVMDVLHAYVDAQQEYAGKNCSGTGLVEFAQRIVSSAGKHDGLYWEAKEGEDQSPLGPLVAKAAKEGYANPELNPFHGYYFRVLRGQGKHAKGGTYNYVVKDRMILGFGLVAYPAEYGNSGVMTFIVNQEGVIYQKNLGKDTRRKAEAMKVFDPDKTWKKVADTEKKD